MPETTEPQSQEPTPEPTADDAEKAYWERMSKTLEETVTTVVDKKLKELLKSREGSRSDKPRTTLPGLLADFMYGPAKK